MNKVLRACAVVAVLLAAPPAVSAEPQSPAPKRYVFIVMTNPVAGKEAEYNDWYTNVHLRDLLKVPGVKAAQRYVVAKENKVASKYKYLAIYEVETTDLAATQTAMLAMADTPDMVISPALDRTDASAIYFQEASPRVSAK